jgi:dihydroorotate dehydrogenase electron transfer subunit
MSRGSGSPRAESGPQQVRAEVLSIRKVGDYHVVALAVPGVAELTSPGHFAAIAVGGSPTSMLLRRCFSIYNVDTAGALGGTIELVIDAHGPGTRWIVERSRGDVIDVVAPLGRPFSLPKEPVSCVLVGGGYGSAPLFMLADRLRKRGCRVDLILGAASESRLYGLVEGRRRATTLTVTTDDGSVGIKGRVTDVIDKILDANDGQVIYGCGPMGMLAALAGVAERRGIVSQCAVEEAMACGVGVCMTCVLPIIGADGVTRLARSCTEGPVFFGDAVRWKDVGTVPNDCLGALKPVAATTGRGR